MNTPKISITPAAIKFIEKMGITDVTFDVVELHLGGILGIVKEIAPSYEAPGDATGHKFFRVDDLAVFIDRRIEIFGPLILKAEGFWKKQLALGGVKPSFFNF
jgi:hypothetical protein